MVHEQGEQIVLDMHMAKNNPQWQEFFDDEVMVVFSGPHAYVSPRWYEEQERVPTWNYAAVHAYGVPKLVRGRARKARIAARGWSPTLDPQWLPKFDALRPEVRRRDARGHRQLRDRGDAPRDALEALAEPRPARDGADRRRSSRSPATPPSARSPR